MPYSTGDTIWGVRHLPNGTEDWVQYQLDSTFAETGGMAKIFNVLPPKNPTLLAKVYYNDHFRHGIRNDPAYVLRLYSLATSCEELAEKLPFGAWPRRMLFPLKSANSIQQARDLLGFTMAKRSQHITLLQLTHSATARQGMTRQHAVFLAEQIASQLHRLHTHHGTFLRAFAIGDLSPNNILIKKDFSESTFIDLDAIGFTDIRTTRTYITNLCTARFRPPQSFEPNYIASAQTDDFLLAIHLFMLLMASQGCDQAHPFYAPVPYAPYDCVEHKHIHQRIFPYANAALRQHMTRFAPLPIYDSWPPELRQAFEGVFTGTRPMSANDWSSTLANLRRSLQRR